MLWFLRGIGTACMLLTAWMVLHSLKAQLRQRKRMWKFIHTIASIAVPIYILSDLALGWMYLNRFTRIFCAACWIFLSICCLFSAILDCFRNADDPYISLRHFNHDFTSLLFSILVALLPLFPAYLYIVL